MKFFKRRHTQETTEDLQPAITESANASVTPAAEVSPTNTPSDGSHTEVQTIDTNTPGFQQLVRQEAKKIRLKEQILSAPHLARIEDALRLNETKMENIDENLERTRKMQERVRRFQELNLEMREQKSHLFEVNKQKAANAKEIEDLERFEEFENVQGQFQRLSVWEKLRREQKQRLSEISREIDVASKSLEDEKKRLFEQQDEKNDAHRQLTISLDAISEALQIEGRGSYLSILERRCTERHHQLASQLAAMEKEVQEQNRILDDLNEKIEKIRTRRQSIAPHTRMAIHGELVIERLNKLAELETELASVEQLQKETDKKEANENELLERVYSNYQQVEQKIQALKDELEVHRENNHGLESYRLQERAMKMKLRRSMLLSAQSLWNRIAEGYARIEEVMQTINSLRLKEETLAGNIEKAEKELYILRRTCREKEYTYTLSKSQNVIQLRSDLKEGTSCTVCGATHHPYHSDTMLEQNKLISEIKMELDTMAAELKAKEELLSEMELEHSAVKATKEETENKLIMLRQLQNGYTQDWKLYTSLDRTFEQCDSTVNADARTAMLRQLVENIGTEVDDAQKELDTFNFHQKRINELSEQIANLERDRTEIITRLNEVNTGCQVMAGQSESAQSKKQKVNDAYTMLFGQLDNMITIPDWSNTWKRSHEALLMRVQELTDECNGLDAKLAETEHLRAIQEQKMDFMNVMHQTLLDEITHTENDKQECREQLSEDTEKLERLIGKTSCKQELKRVLEDYQKACQNFEKQQSITHASEIRQQQAQGSLNEHLAASAQTDERAAEERQGLDLWMRQYNANHPPVQYSELESIFGTDRSWNDLRTMIRAIEMDSLLTQARVDKLGSLLISLQAEGNLNVSDTDMVQNQLASQIETYENRRRETMMQIASLTMQLQVHQKAEETIKEEKMRENSHV